MEIVKAVIGRENREEVRKLRVKVWALRSALNSLRRPHTHCEDGFYSCPKDEDYFGPDESGECNCGADADNGFIDRMLEITK